MVLKIFSGKIHALRIAIVLSTLAILLLAGNASALSNGNGSWQYYRNIIINNTGGTLTDYQVLINLNSSNFPTNAQNSGADIRFTDATGNELSYWIESWDFAGTNAKIWVKVPSIPTGESIISIYYGNPSTTSSSNIEATFIRIIDGDHPLVGSWHFDEGFGIAAHDTSGNRNDGVLVNEPLWIDGKFGKALNFDGVDDYVEVPNDNSLALWNSFTLEAWIYQQDALKDGRIIDKVTAGTSDGLHLDTYPSGRNLRSCSGGPCISGTTEYTLNSWHHVVAIFDNGDLKLYLNGALDGSGKVSSPLTGNNLPLRIGFCAGGPCSHEYFKGIIDEVRIYSRALTAEEILDIYNNYGYTTNNYPGRVLIRRYASPEPSISVGAAMQEAPSLLSIIGIFLTPLLVILVAALVVLWLWMLIDCLKRPDDKFAYGGNNARLIWILVIIFVGFIGALIYYFLIKKTDKEGKGGIK